MKKLPIVKNWKVLMRKFEMRNVVCLVWTAMQRETFSSVTSGDAKANIVNKVSTPEAVEVFAESFSLRTVNWFRGLFSVYRDASWCALTELYFTHSHRPRNLGNKMNQLFIFVLILVKTLRLQQIVMRVLKLTAYNCIFHRIALSHSCLKKERGNLKFCNNKFPTSCYSNLLLET